MPHPARDPVHITLEGTDVTVAVPPGQDLLTAFRKAGLTVNAACGGDARCGLCRVRFHGTAPPPTPDERYLCGETDVGAGWRLACQTTPSAHAVVSVPEGFLSGSLRVLTDAAAPAGGEAGAAPTATGCGAAIDVGTTTVVCYLADLAQSRPLGAGAFPNPQRAFGADVITRIMYAHESAGQRQELQTALVSEIERHLADLCAAHAIAHEDLVAITAVGNSTMMHLLWGVDPWPLGVAPYEPVFTSTAPVPGAQLGFARFAHTTVTLMPGIGGQLGSDTVAGLVALGPAMRRSTSLFLDLGTNGEIVLTHGDLALGCSCAAGPAFEGVHISCGVPAMPGAIERVALDTETLTLETIDGAPPRGLCGSGLADAVAVLLRARAVAPNGRLVAPDAAAQFLPPALARRLEDTGDGRAFVLHSAGDSRVALTQRDIREVQLAKGAIRVGVELLLREAGLAADAVQQVFVGGAFGTALRPESVLDLGLLPDTLRGRVRPVGNVAGLGAQLALLFEDRREEADRLAGWVQHVPLAAQPDFEARFAAHLAFPSPD